MRRRRLSLAIPWAAVATAGQLVVAGPVAASPLTAQAMRIQAVQAGPLLLDGRCDEAAWTRASPTRLDEGLTISAVADRDSVTVCWRFPIQTLSLDLYIEDAAGALHDLHVSAQTGERTRNAQGWPDWTAFGQHRGWYAPSFAFGGFRTDESGTRRVVFAPQPYRELQLTKARFGPGPWRVMVEAQAMEPGAKVVRYPAEASPDDPATWGSLDPGS
jgi:hypothetical protein